MEYKAIIFDFNGTLLWDTHLHNEAWDIFLEQHGFDLTDEEKNETIHGKQNQLIFKDLFSNNISPEEIGKYTLEKEKIYQNLCLEEKLGLGPGAFSFLDNLKEAKIPFTIATSSGIENVSFYFENYNLDRWFSIDDIVYNNGKIKSKPSPDIFEVAMEKLECSPQQAIIFEDSQSGIMAAEAAKAGKIVIVNSIDEDYSRYGHDVITHFEQFEMEVIK
ncbi:HAD family hydrolase [Vibrio salinus]|uniref:HAD family hydrolase n=1 Tax=Vibrio salinus TaxID=2899784 RepID=UPI001E626CA0|nr:HAD family phosphatase [Vibrio salinus]MCE0492738.1 HAD family phosphatase [Vibrio salinus]